MGIILTATAGFSLWIVMWALGIKAFDAFMLTTLMILVAATARIVSPYLPGNRE